MADYAKQKAFKINELVRTIHQDSFEWYGFTLGSRDNPEVIIDIGLPRNDQNLSDYATIGPKGIAEFQESLADDAIVNGWIHSHGALHYKHFSHTDEKNHLVVLDFVSARLRKPVAKREIPIKDLSLLVKDQFGNNNLQQGSVSLITDKPIAEATIMETVYGSFCYAIVIGDEGWHEQEIHYRESGILTGQTRESSKETEITVLDTDRSLVQLDINGLSDEVEEKIRPNTNPPPEMIERM
jgi:hypothetical protein